FDFALVFGRKVELHEHGPAGGERGIDRGERFLSVFLAILLAREADDRKVPVNVVRAVELRQVGAERNAPVAEKDVHRRAGFVVPVRLTGAEVDATAVANKFRLYLRARGAEDDRIMTVVRIAITQRRENVAEEFVARAVRLFQRGFTEDVGFRL